MLACVDGTHIYVYAVPTNGGWLVAHEHEERWESMRSRRGDSRLATDVRVALASYSQRFSGRLHVDYCRVQGAMCR
jgi:hypothetical protein